MGRRGSGQTFIVKSVQQDTASIATLALSGTATITAVDLANSLIFFNGFHSSVLADPDLYKWAPRVELTNTTTVTVYRGTADAATVPSVGFTVVTFYPGILKRVHRGTIAISSGTSNTATLSPEVNTSRAFVTWLGTSSTVSADARMHWPTVVLTDASTVTATVNTAVSGFTTTTGYQVAEFHFSPLYGTV